MKSLVSVVLCFFLFSCAGTHAVTKTGIKVGESFNESAALGLISAEEAIKSWEYVDGVIQGVLINVYQLEVPESIKVVMKRLNELAEKEKYTDKEKGEIIGLLCAFEVLAIQNSWDRFGFSLFNTIFRG